MHLTLYPNLKLAALTLGVNAALFSSFAVHAADEDLPSVTLPAITVMAETETADGPVNGIAASTVSSTTGTNESILKSPQSVTVVGQQEIEITGADDMHQALEYSSGVTTSNPFEKTTMQMEVRGFSTYGAYRDGQKYQLNRFDGQQELYGLERIEVVKGPNSVLDGAMAPGGVINAISKKPYFANGYEVNAEVGSFNHKKVSTDINQKINDKLAIRLVGVYQDSDSFQNYVPDDRTYIAPSLTWIPSNDTKLTLQADYQNINTMYTYALPFEGVLKDSKHGKIARDRFPGIPDFDNYDNDRYTLGYELNHKVNPNLEIKHNLRRFTSSYDFPITYRLGALDDEQRIYKRSATDRHDDSETLTSGISAKYKWSLNDRIDNVALVGVDYSNAEHTSERADATATNIDIFSPTRNEDKLTSEFGEPYTWNRKQIQKGVYLQNQLTWNDKLVATVGVRHDKADLAFEYLNEADKDYSEEPEKYSATTGRVGLVYLMDNGIAPYVSYSQSFEPELGRDRAENAFEPLEGEQYEIGIRYQPDGPDTLLTGSVYRIVQSNVLVDDPEDNDFKIQLGEVRSQGMELEAKTQLSNNINLIAAYSYSDIRNIKANPLYPEDEGKRIENVPYNTLAVWGDYRFSDFGIPQLKFGVGARFKEGVYINDSEINELPSYTLVDAMASYNWSDNMKLSININNLLDEEYSSCIAGYGCFYGEPRNIVGKVTYKW